MNDHDNYKALSWSIAIFAVSIVFFGCCGPSFKPTTTFPAPIPENAKISVNINENGKFFIADQYGETVSLERISFSELVGNTNVEGSDWMNILGSYTLYRIKGDSHLWICDGDFRCGVGGGPEGNAKEAIFSVNYDGERLFVGGSNGRPITEKDLSSFISLVREAGFNEKISLKTVSIFNVYKFKGSIKFVTCTPNNICYCTCYDPVTKRTTACINGQCN